MKYFTPDRYVALQKFDKEGLNAADEDWEDAVDRYDAYLISLRPEMPESVRQLLDGFYLHDARVLSMGRSVESFVIVLKLDVPPYELLTITYSLVGSPEINQEVLPIELRSPDPCWLYEEIEQVQAGNPQHFMQSILFSNGWEVRIPFRAVQLETAIPVFPPASPSRNGAESTQVSKSA